LTIVIRLVFALLGALGAVQAAAQTDFTDSYSSSSRYLVWVAIVLGGAFAGWLIGVILGSAAARAIRRVETAATNRSASELLVGGIGLLLGLATAALLSLAILRLPYVGGYLLLPVFLLLGYVFAMVAARKARSLLRLIGINAARFESPPGAGRRTDSSGETSGGKLVDTSAIIDGRIADIVETGFLEGELIVPVFVLEELQRVADSSDPQRRARGRRGLEVVHDLRVGTRQMSTPDVDYRDLQDVDAKLLRLAQDRGLPILTTDYNLNKVARIQGVTVLNVNELANALKPAVLPGESLRVKVIREGKEQEQGVGYLDDGTMIVVEGGRTMVGTTVDVEVTSVLQSPSGKMIFSRVGG
jgi:uncharacterized protein YacL